MKRGPHTVTPWDKSKQSKEEKRIKELNKKFKNRSIIKSIAKKDWPYPPEPDCQKEWENEGNKKRSRS